MKLFLRTLMLLALICIPSVGYPAESAAPAADSKAATETVMPSSEPAADSSVPDGREAEMQFPIVRAIGGMGLVLFLMVGAFFAAKKFAPRYFNKPVSQRNLKIVETLGMGDRRSISLVEVGNNRFLIGNTPHQINLLATLPEPVSLVSEPEAPTVAAPKEAGKKGSGAPFKNLFEIEKSRPVQKSAHPLPEDLRVKMRQLRESLERS